MDIITGDPGAGKTLLAIKLLTDKYFFWHNKDRCFYRKEDSKKYVIYTNIDGFKLPHRSLTEAFKDVPFDVFFSKEHQDSLHEETPHIIYLLDECQQYIDKYYRKREVIFYFDYHRHYGDVIYLITQHITKICKDISILHDYEYRAVNRTFSFTGEFRYNIKSKGEKVKGYSFRASKKYFDLYTSFTGDNKERRINPVMVTLAAFVVVFLLMGWYFYSKITPDSPPPSSSSASQVPTSQESPRQQPHAEPIRLSEIEPPIDQIYSVALTGWCERSDKLFMFVDPITQNVLTPDQALYDIKKFGTAYYALLTLTQYTEMKKVNEYTNQINTPNMYSHSDKIVSGKRSSSKSNFLDAFH